MTRFDPTLIITRLAVLRGKHIVYDEPFHKGVNVIRGENSSGKSTVLNFIYYGLGGDLSDWSETALLCTRVVVEASFNGLVATLAREISPTSGQPMEIFGGPYEQSTTAALSEWVKYPYRRSTNQESFSQALFRLLGIPEVASDVSGNLTMHQVLRLLYSDQLSPVETLFRYDTRFDPPAIRDAVGRLLCGAYDGRLYQNEIEIRNKTREFDSLNGQLRSLFAVLGRTEHNLTIDWLIGERNNLLGRQNKLNADIEAAERDVFASAGADELSLKAQEAAYDAVSRIQNELFAVQKHRDKLLLSIADSAAFIRTLRSKISALGDASAVAEYLGDVRFSVCPACLSPVAEDHSEGSCHLCKTSLVTGHARDRIVSIINDAAIQLKQSETLQGTRDLRLAESQATLSRLQTEWQAASTRLSAVQSLPSTEAREALRELQRASGYVERQIEDLAAKEGLVRLIDEVSAKKNNLNAAIGELRSENERLRASQERRLSRSMTMIADEIRMLLKNDLRRQDSFENPRSIDFDFATNSITVDGHTYFSASSRVILKSSFFLGFLAAATKEPQFRHPRFVMIDTIEDKGMEPERSHNFQNQILRVSREAISDHQIIYATAMIAPDLDDEEFLIGRFSTRDAPTLAIDN